MISGSWPTGAKSAALTVNGAAVSDELVSIAYTDDLTGGSAMTIGAAAAARVRFVVDGPSVDYEGAAVSITIGGIPLGTFYVTDHSERDGRLTVDAVDAMGTAAMREAYVPAASSGTALGVAGEICAALGLTMGDTGGITDAAVSGLSEGHTYREMLGHMAAVLGRNAHIDRHGRLVFRWYEAPAFGNARAEDTGGGNIDLRGVLAREQSGGVQVTYGVEASEIGEGAILLTVKGTCLVPADEVYAGELTKKTADAALTGIAVAVTTVTADTETDGAGNVTATEERRTSVLAAGGTPAVSLRCDYMSQAVLDGIFARIGGFSYRPMTLSFYGDCRVETGDVIRVTDRDGQVYDIPVSAVTHSWDGGVKTTVTAGAPVSFSGGSVTAALSRVSSELAALGNREASNVEALSRRIGNETASREAAIQALSGALAGAGGLYETTETPAGGGTVYYLHDKADLASSGVVLKLTAQALGISTDGGQTYPAGWDFVSGTTITNILQTVGVAADWITSGRVQSRNGRVYFDLDDNVIVCSQLQASRPWDSTTGTDPGDVVVDISKRNISGSTWASYANIYKSGNEGNGLCIMPPVPGGQYSPDDRVLVFTWGDNPIELRHHSGMTGNADYTSVLCLDENRAELFAKSSTSNNLSGFWMDDTGIHASGDLSAGAVTAVSLAVSGVKQRVVDTEDYGVRSFYCYETPTPMFGDVGEGVLGEDGRCAVFPDPVFARSVAPGQYQVFLQSYGPGECFVTERSGDRFLVEGTPGLRFGWELKARQAGFSQRRLDKHTPEASVVTADYGGLALAHIASLRRDPVAAAHLNHMKEREGPI